MADKKWVLIFRINYLAIGIFVGMVLLVGHVFRNNQPDIFEKAAKPNPGANHEQVRNESHRENSKVDRDALRGNHEEHDQGASPQESAGANLVLKLLLMAHGRTGSNL